MGAVAPSSVPIQQPSLQFGNPVSEAAFSAMGAAINYILSIVAPVATVWPSMLFDGGDGTHPSVNFQDQLGDPNPATWVLADGRSVVGSTYQALTGNTNVPDLRGITVRGCNYGGSSAGTRADGDQNPDGSLAPGTYTTDRFAAHVHAFQTDYTLMTDGGSRGAGNDGDQYGTNPVALDGQIKIASTGGTDTAPKNVSMNWFIRIN